MKITNVKKQQEEHLEECCSKHNINISSIRTLLEVEKIKKLTKRNHYILQTIDLEIENSIK